METKFCYDLTPAELENSSLDQLARKAGYASVKACLNDNNWWNLSTETLRAELNRQNNLTRKTK